MYNVIVNPFLGNSVSWNSSQILSVELNQDLFKILNGLMKIQKLAGYELLMLQNGMEELIT